MAPPPGTPGPQDHSGGDFVLLEPTAVPADAATTPDLAEGSDVHDVEDLEHQLGAEALDAMLRDYLADERDVPALPAPPKKPVTR